MFFRNWLSATKIVERFSSEAEREFLPGGKI